MSTPAQPDRHQAPYSHPVPSLTAASLEAALRQTTGTNPLAAALLLALPLDAAPGIDLYFDDAKAGFRGVSVPRSDSAVETALRLRAAYLATSPPPLAFRDLDHHNPDDRLGWVGWYRSGTHLYSAGLWEFFGVADLAVPAEPSPPLSEIVSAVLACSDRSAARPAELPLVETPHRYSVRFPADPSQNFAQVSVAATDGTLIAPQSPATQNLWDIIDDAALNVGLALGASTVSVPLGSSETSASADIIATLATGERLVVPVFVDTEAHSLQVGVPLSRIDRSQATVATEPLGFEILGLDRTEPGVALRHIDSGLICLLTP